MEYVFEIPPGPYLRRVVVRTGAGALDYGMQVPVPGYPGADVSIQIVREQPAKPQLRLVGE